MNQFWLVDRVDVVLPHMRGRLSILPPVLVLFLYGPLDIPFLDPVPDLVPPWAGLFLLVFIECPMLLV